MTRTKFELISNGRRTLLERLAAELKAENDDSSTDQFIEAEHTVDSYLDAVAAGSDSVPGAEDLAFSCAVLLAATGTLTSPDLDVLGRLNAPEAGVCLYAAAHQIREMKARAIEALENVTERAEETAGDADIF